jgi:hypothetical protein
MATPPAPAAASFQHRSNADGTYDSICLDCFRTVVSTLFPAMLLFTESTHSCSPMDLRPWMIEPGRR